MDGTGDGKLPGGDTSHSVARPSHFVPSHADLLDDDSVVPSVETISQDSTAPAAPNKRRGGVSFATNTEIIGPTLPIEGPRRMSSPNLSPMRGDDRNIFDTDDDRAPPKTGCVGLKNLGNTCYMNSVLQCLLHEPTFFNFFADYENTSKSEGKGFKETALTPVFRDLFNNYWTSKSNYVRPKDFKERLDVECTMFAGYFQHDGQEFLAVLLDRIHEEIVAATKPATDSDHLNIIRAISNDGSSDSAFLSAGSDTNQQSSPFSDNGASAESKSRKRQSSGSSQADSPQNPASPINNAFNKVSLSDSPKHQNTNGSPSTSKASGSQSTPSQPAKRPRLTSECTIVSDDPKKLWDKYMQENLSPISKNFQGQFASELCCKMCNNRSTTYENFMYLIVPVPNPEKRTLAVKYASHQNSYFSKLAVQVSKKSTAYISEIVDAAKELLEKNKQDVSDLDLWEMSDGQIRKLINRNDYMCMLPSRENSEIIMMNAVDLRNEPEVTEMPREDKVECNICLTEFVLQELLTCPYTCGITVCAECAKNVQETKECMKCKEKLDKYDEFAEGSTPINITSAPAPHEEQLSIVSLKYRDSNGDLKPCSVPFSVRISKKTNSSKLYNYVTMYLMQFLDTYEFDILYSDSKGEKCSKCSYGSECKGCIVPPDFDIQLKQGDNFVVICSQEIQNATWENSDSYNDLFDKAKRPSLSKCLKEFKTPEELGDDCVFCQKCQKNTSATKTMMVQRFPDTLIIYLKRFVFEQAISKKIDTEVLFERVGLDVSALESADGEKAGKYNLIGSIQHFGNVNAGHYTAYAKDPFDGKWNYYDDQIVEQRRPISRDAKDVYILFYRRENAKSSNKALLETVISNAPEEIKRVGFEEVPQIASCQINTMDSTEDLVWMDATVPTNAPRVSPIGSPIRRVGGTVNIQTCSPCASDDNCGPDSDREELDLDLDYQVDTNQCQSEIPDAVNYPDPNNGNFF